MVQFYATVVSYLATMTETREEGQGLVEYALIIALVAVFCIGALMVLGDNITELLEGISFGGE